MNDKLMKINLSANALIEKKFTDSLLEINSTTQKYGLVVTEDIAREITEARQTALKENDRVDFNPDTSVRLVKAFSESYYITQDTFSETIGEMLDLFYFIKNETNNAISDDEIIKEMLTVFNETCFGVMEVMQSKGLEKILRKHKFGDTNIWDDYEKKKLKFGDTDVWHDYEKLEEKLRHDDTWRE